MIDAPLISTRLQPGVTGAPEAGAVSTASARDGQTVETVRPVIGAADTRLKPGANERVQPDPWGPYANPDDISRLVYGRMMWRLPDMRARLLAHWLDERHPHRKRFAERRALVENILTSTESDVELDARLRSQQTSLRAMAREIPPVFGSFF